MTKNNHRNELIEELRIYDDNMGVRTVCALQLGDRVRILCVVGCRRTQWNDDAPKRNGLVILFLCLSSCEDYFRACTLRRGKRFDKLSDRVA